VIWVQRCHNDVAEVDVILPGGDRDLVRARDLALAVAVFAALVLPREVRAQRSVAMLEVGADAQSPIAAPTLDRYYPGGGLTAAALFAPYPFLLPVFRLEAAFFGDGPAPADARVVDPGVGSLFALTAGARIRVDGFSQSVAEPEATGFYAELDVGAALTGNLVRPVFEIGVGWAFDLGTFGDAGQLDLGPVLRFTHLLQTDDRGLDGNSAYIVTLGVALVVFDAAPRPEEIAARRAVEEQRDRERTDADGDGIVDLDDACPQLPEDADGYQDEDGCPDADDDGDGILDASDACPRAPEDADGFEDENGCPDPDNDGDGILDGVDRCPNEPETVNGNDDADGCPDEGLIVFVDDRVVLEEHVLFDLNQARVRHAARPILAAVVALIRQHPEWVHLRVEGHADEQGEEEWNVELSRRRAHQVRRVLIELGAPETLLDAEGYGSSRPRVEGDSEEAYRANRRVEIVVTERATTGETP
jgi:outer membrane protein OmpA-like peptidoglycan-associated protein